MPPGDGITHEEMVRESYIILCRSTPGKPSLCDRVGGLESMVADLRRVVQEVVAARAKDVQPTGWQKFTGAMLQGAGGAAGAFAMAALLLGLTFKLNPDAAIAANRFQPREAQRATP